MKAMIFAAGKGTRMRDMCRDIPKVLLPIQGKPLLVHHLERLKAANIHEIVINVSHLGDKIKKALGNGQSFGVRIEYSEETSLLETGGGLLQALPLLGSSPFIVISGDIWTDYPLAQLPSHLEGLAHLVLNDRFEQNLAGDFTLNGTRLSNGGVNKLNFAGIGVYHPALLQGCQPGVFKLAPLLKKAATLGLVTGEFYSGAWFNIGTPNAYQQALRRTIY